MYRHPCHSVFGRMYKNYVTGTPAALAPDQDVTGIDGAVRRISTTYDELASAVKRALVRAVFVAVLARFRAWATETNALSFCGCISESVLFSLGLLADFAVLRFRFHRRFSRYRSKIIWIAGLSRQFVQEPTRHRWTRLAPLHSRQC